MSKESYKTISYLLAGGIGLVVGLIGVWIIDLVMSIKFRNTYIAGIDGGDVFLVLFCVVVCALIFGPYFYNKFYGDKHTTELRTVAKYDYTSKILEITKKSPELSDIIKIQEYLFSDLSYNDPTLVYTGATVGGVSMGGFHVEGGDYDQKLSRSGRYQLIYREPIAKTDFVIHGIKLPKALVSTAASNAVISKYLNGDTIVPFYKSKMDESMAKLARDSVASGDMAKALTAAQRANIEKFLTKEDCTYIKQWLCCEI